MDASANVMCKFYTENVKVLRYETSVICVCVRVTATTEDGMSC